MELMTVKGESVVSLTPAIAPITVPTGQPPTVTTLSVGVAAASAQGAADVKRSFLGLDLSNAEGMKNAIFLGFVGFFIFKYGRRIFK